METKTEYETLLGAIREHLRITTSNAMYEFFALDEPEKDCLGLPFHLWERANDLATFCYFGALRPSERNSLKHLASIAGGWWVVDQQKREWVFLDMPDWEIRFRIWEQH